MRWGKTWRLLQKVTYHNKADYSADCFAAAEMLHIWITPRMGGEKHQSFTLLLRHRGSPPHGRGKGRRRCRTGDGFGITPAWAGKRGVEKTPCLWYTDHPRVGGEKHSMRLLRTSYMGSPPRWRGKTKRCPECLPAGGITPAWAGKRWGRCADTGADRDHPRMGGEKITRIAPKNWGSGSPPRRRGKASVWHYR